MSNRIPVKIPYLWPFFCAILAWSLLLIIKFWKPPVDYFMATLIVNSSR